MSLTLKYGTFFSLSGLRPHLDSCMEFLKKSNLIATGIDDGNIKLWLIEISSYTLLQTK